MSDAALQQLRSCGRCSRTVGRSQGHVSGMQAVATFEVYQDEDGGYRWRFRVSEDEVIAASGRAYERKGSCEGALTLVKLFARDAEVLDQTQHPSSEHAPG